MNVCIIGGGPSGLFLAKYLSPHVNLVTIHEKSNSIGGMYRFSHNPKMNIFNRILNKNNIKFIGNSEITKENFKEIEEKHDKFVIATGGIPNYHPSSGLINSMDIIKGIVKPEKLGKKVSIIGMGNVALDVCRKILKNVNEIDIYSRGSLYASKFGNSEMRDLQNLANIKAFNLTVPTNNKEKRRHDLVNNNNEESSPYKPLITLNFNTAIKKVTKKDGFYHVEYNDGEIRSYDSVISSYGFKPNPLKLQTNKPVYKVGWCERAFGNINDAMFTAKKLAMDILT